MKLAIMQPYFFPYLGYWQLMHFADRFVIYDDVNYIKGGWVNRNRIIVNGTPRYITIPLSSASSHRRICDIELSKDALKREKLTKTIECAYKSAPHFGSIYPLVKTILFNDTFDLAEYLRFGIKLLSTYLNLSTEFVDSSRCYGNSALRGQERVLDICAREHATTYINLAGGRDLYAPEDFNARGVDLRFLSMNTSPYPQRFKEFIPYMSIIDLLMEVGRDTVVQYLEDFKLGQ